MVAKGCLAVGLSLLSLCRVGGASPSAQPGAHLSAVAGLSAIQATAQPAPLPGPPYPPEAMEKRIQGVAVVKVIWNGAGQVATCRIVTSSGSALLDQSTVAFIEHHWMSPQMAGKSVQTPITYRLQAAPSVPRKGDPASLEQLLAGEGFTWTTSREGTRNANLFEVEINGKRFSLVLDTGSARTMIGRRAVEGAGLSTLPFALEPLGGINGSLPGNTQILLVNSFKIGNQSCVSQALVVSEFEKMRNNGRSIEGLLGLPFLKANHAVIVVNPPVLFLNPAHAPSAELDQWLRARGCTAVPLDYTRGLHFEASVRLNGFPSRLWIDTGATFSLLNEDVLTHDGIVFQPARFRIGGGISGQSMSVGTVNLSGVEMGDFPFGAMSAETVPKQMLLRDPDGSYPGGLFGFGDLGNVYTVIDTSNNRLYLRPFPRH